MNEKNKFFSKQSLRNIQSALYTLELTLQQKGDFFNPDYTRIVDQSIDELKETTIEEKEKSECNPITINPSAQRASSPKKNKKKSQPVKFVSMPNKTVLSVKSPLAYKFYSLAWEKKNCIWEEQAQGYFETLFAQINAFYGTGFVRKQIKLTTEQENAGDCPWTWTSGCIFDREGFDDRIVTAYLDRIGYCRIYCYHKKCEDFNKYLEITNLINSNICSMFEMFRPFLFQFAQGETIQAIFDEIYQISETPTVQIKEDCDE